VSTWRYEDGAETPAVLLEASGEPLPAYLFTRRE